MTKLKVAAAELEGLVWRMENPTPGQKVREIELDWTFKVGPRCRISDPQSALLLSELQGFMRIALQNRQGGVRMDAGSAANTFVALQELARFMHSEKLQSIAEITSEKSWEFVEYFRNFYTNVKNERGRRRAITHASAWKVLHPLTQIYGLAIDLRNAGHAVLPEAPYSGMSTYAVVNSYLKLERSGPHRPIPDDIAIPVLSNAATLVLIGSEDLLALRDQVLAVAPMTPDAHRRNARFKEMRDIIGGYEFALNPRTGKPWHGSIEPRGRSRVDHRGMQRTTYVQGFRRLVQSAVGGCITLISATTGMRSHELIGLDCAESPDGSLACLESQVSADGLMEIFFIRGVTAKREIAEHRWTAGLRPLGSNAVPITVAAVRLLVELLRPWREMMGTTQLLVNFRTRLGLPLGPGSVGLFTNDSLTDLQREFAVDALTEAGLARADALNFCEELQTQRWRTTFAQAVFRTNPQLMPALRDHFRHISELVTDRSYIGSDASLLDDLESERIQETARTLLRMSMGTQIGAGSVQRLLRDHRDELAAAINEMPGDSDMERAVSYVMTNDVRIWRGNYASCLINLMPKASRCNPYAAHSPGFATPDYGRRSPSICASCGCGLILPDHKDFWSQRHASNLRIVEEEKKAGLMTRMQSVAAKRVAQSRAILRALDRGATENETFGDDVGSR